MIIIFILLLCVAGVLVVFAIRPGVNSQLPTKHLTMGNTTFRVEVADTELTRMRGLSGRAELGEQEGMLFIFPLAANYTFWMKGMNFSLDMIWINGDTIVGTTENIPPPSGLATAFKTYAPPEPVTQVLEVTAGTTTKYHLQRGDRVTIEE